MQQHPTLDQQCMGLKGFMLVATDPSMFREMIFNTFFGFSNIHLLPNNFLMPVAGSPVTMMISP